jgi:hypothetical protein
MKEKILAPPWPCKIATALFETGAGSGLGRLLRRHEGGMLKENRMMPGAISSRLISLVK